MSPTPPATITLSSKTANTVAASASSPCTVSPASAALTRPGRMADYTADFVVGTTAAAGPGACTVTLRDRKGKLASVAVQLVASQVRLRQQTLVTGTTHTCALDAQGAAWCWGFNQYGSLGIGTTDNPVWTPTVVVGGLRFSSLTAGGLHTCGLTSAGTAWCWGAGESGQLGNGVLADQTSPTAVSGGLTFVQLSASGLATCGLTPAGTAYCWGRNNTGQLGDGSFEDKLVPTPVTSAAGGEAVVFASLEAGGGHTCGLTSTGKAYCWGLDDGGQLGDGGTQQLLVPNAVSTTLAFTELTARNSSTCGLSGGALYCWGYNSNGQLGDGTTTSHGTPTAAGGASFAALGAGATNDGSTAAIQSCGLDASGAAYCWGVNNFGQLGDGTTTDRSTPIAVTGPGGGSALAFAGLATGGTHTCGRTTGGLIYCWGWNHLGQLGDGTSTDEPTPHLVSVPGISPTITSLVIDPTTIPIESFAGYTVGISNPGPTLSDVFVQAWVVQGTTKKGAGGTHLNCSGQFDGQLPASCTMSYTALVSNGSQGSGTLVAGGAMFQIDLFSGATTYDSESIPITLQ
jgi:alpha-tubulin suppressor-like RCC1 family protein